MRVGVYLPGLSPTDGGGYTLERELGAALAEAAPARGHEVVLFVDARPDPSLAVRQVPVPSPALRRTRQGLAGASRELLRLTGGSTRLDGAVDQLLDPWTALVRAQGIDFMLYPSPARMRVLTAEVPYLLTVWDLDHLVTPGFPEFSADGDWDTRERFYARALRRASAIATGTEHGRGELARRYGVDPATVRRVPFYTPSDCLDPPGPAPLDEPTLPEGFALYPAQFWPHKNHIGLLHALRRARDELGLRLPLVLVGSDKGNRAHVEACVRELGLQAQVQLLGFVPRPVLLTLYRRSLFTVYATLAGWDGLPPLEAMALGSPVLALDVGGTAEQLGDAALLVPPRDDALLAQALRRMHDDTDLRQTLRARGRRRAEASTLARYVRDLLDVVDNFATYRRCWASSS